jgi:hypothetical protein
VPAAKVLVVNVAVVPLMVPVPITTKACFGVPAVPAPLPHPTVANKPMVAVRTSKATNRRRTKDEDPMEVETGAMRDLKFMAKTLFTNAGDPR